MTPCTIVRPSRMLAITVIAAALTTQIACDAGREFRTAALPMVESGVKDIVDGLMEGLFAAIEVDSATGGS